MLGRFLALLGVCVATLLWLACRAGSPSYLRSVMDFCMQAALGGVAAGLALKMLYLYAFQIPDLLLMVVVLSLGMKGVIEEAQPLAQLGIINARHGDPGHWGVLLQLCLLADSFLLLGAAFGLRSCKARNLEKTLPRLVNLLAGMLALPAAAGVVVFPVWLLKLAIGEAGVPQLLRKIVISPYVLTPALPQEPPPSGHKVMDVALLALCWLTAIIITALNSANLVKNLTLSAEIGDGRAQKTEDRNQKTEV